MQDDWGGALLRSWRDTLLSSPTPTVGQSEMMVEGAIFGCRSKNGLFTLPHNKQGEGGRRNPNPSLESISPRGSVVELAGKSKQRQAQHLDQQVERAGLSLRRGEPSL